MGAGLVLVGLWSRRLTAEHVNAADEPPPDSRESLVRHAAVMTAGTALSRITGYLRLVALTAALGVTALGSVYTVANLTPNIIYELVLGGSSRPSSSPSSSTG